MSASGSAPPKLRILLADDHAIVREGLAMLIAAQPDMCVVAQAANGREAVQLAREHQPDIAVLDLSMPETPGAEATAHIRRDCPGTRVLALTRHSDPSYVKRLLIAGASGYVLKKSAAGGLINAIRTIADGGTYIEPALAGVLLKESVGPASARAAPGVLSSREEEVLRAIAWGRSNKEIAAELGLSVKTVESYRAAAVEKLNLRSRADVVRYAVGRGWLAGNSE